ncbi:hypothetical protein AL755_21220 [Arthrobacter sp. ERGS1:01]|nr:hypothetical protein AL755_21220 [Arthrobacter sp. ERGS1:01]
MGRILDILELATVSPDGPLTLSEIAAQAHVPLSTTSRLLAQLEEWGFLTGNDAGRYEPGGRLVRMSVTVAAQLHSPAHLLEATKSLAAATGESVTGGLIVGTKMIIVARTESEHPLRAVNRIGELISPVRAALGKAVMSRQSEEQQLELLRGAGYGDPAAELANLSDELEEVRRVGYAVDEETFAPGLRCRAAPILGVDGRAIGGLSIGGPASRFTREIAADTIAMLFEQTQLLSGIGKG